MAYLFFETWVWLLIAALIGLFTGWLIWNRSGSQSDCSEIQRRLDDCNKRCSELEAMALQNTNANQKNVDENTGLPLPIGEHSDDLKKISGIGPTLEQTLNKLGITQFSQIAAFSAENINWVNDYLSFSGRIERENWVAQATKLAAGEATEFSSRYD